MYGAKLADLYLEQVDPNEHVSLCKNSATLKSLEERIWGPEVSDSADA